MGQESTAMRKNGRLEARIPARQKELSLKAAAIRGQSLTEFVVSSATMAAADVIRESEILELSGRDQRAFAEALLDPPPPAEGLAEAARRFRERRD